MNRREFASALGVALATTLAPALRSARAVQPRTRLARIGLELYSVRDAMRADPNGTLAQVRAMGYDDVELLWSFNNFGQTREQVRAALDREGLRAPAAHIAPDTIRTDWERHLDTARFLGHQCLVVPSLPAETSTSLDAWRRWADHFNSAGAVARRADIWLAFHNEPGHMRAIDGVVPYDLFLERTDPAVVRHQLDFGNLTMGGGDPLEYLARHGARYHSFHIKDVLPSRRSDTELGTGIVNIKACLAAIPDINSKPCFVEQEGQARPLENARNNYRYLRDLEF